MTVTALTEIPRFRATLGFSLSAANGAARNLRKGELQPNGGEDGDGGRD